MPPTQASIMFFMRMFAVSWERTKPAVSMANPACMKNTRKPAMSSHAVSTAPTMSVSAAASASWPSAATTEMMPSASRPPASMAVGLRRAGRARFMQSSLRPRSLRGRET